MPLGMGGEQVTVGEGMNNIRSNPGQSLAEGRVGWIEFEKGGYGFLEAAFQIR